MSGSGFSNSYCFKFLSAVAWLSATAFAQETAKVLPVKINRSRAVMVFAQVDSRYNNDGKREVLGAPLNRSVQVAEMKSSSAELNSLYNVLNSVEAGLGDSLYQTNIYTNVSLHAQQYTLAHEYGITRRLTVGVIVPYSRLQGKGSFRAESQNSIASIKAALAARAPDVEVTDEQWKKLEANLPTTATMEKNIFLSKGYKPVQDFDSEGLGDIEVGVKYNFLNLNEKFLNSVKTGFRLPTTSHVADERNILDQSSGDKQLDYALQYVAEWIPVKQYSLSLAMQGTLQFQDTQKNKAVLKKTESGLPDLTNPDNRDNVKRDLGDTFDLEFGTGYGFFNNTLIPSTSYSFYYKQADRYSGGKDYLNYEGLGSNTQAQAHRAEVGLKYSTIPLYVAKKFPAPLEAKVAYQRTLAGKNVVDRQYYRFDLIVYF